MRNTFKTFFVNSSNNQAYNLANKIAKGEVIENTNPLIFYGPSGCGKSHLLDGIWNYYVQNNEKHSEWMSSHGFQATIEGYNYNISNISNFKEISLLLIDDIDIVDDKRNGKFTCEVLEKLIQEGIQICIACTKLPSETYKPELASLFSRGKCVELKLPTKQEQKDFYKYMSKVEGVDIYGDEPYEYLCEKTKDYRTMKSEFVKLRFYMIKDNLETVALSTSQIKKYLEN